MRRIALFLVVASTMTWATTVLVTGCSSSEATTKSGTDAGKKVQSSASSSGDENTSSSGNSSSGNSSSGSTSSSSGGTKDGGADASTSSGGLTSNPNKITCKATECTTAQNCCYTDGKQDQAACGTEAEGCGATFNGFNIACDEKADCGAGELCWWGDGQSTCADTAANAGKPGDNPGQPDIQLCKSDAECGGTVKCTKKTCGFGPEGSAPADLINVTMTVCGTPANCK